MKRVASLIAIGLVLILAGCADIAPRPPDDGSRFVSFDEFLANVKSARFEQYANRRDSRVKDAESFEEMRRHVLYMYDGVKQVSSFRSEDAYADCITIESQPSIRHLGIREIARAPTSSVLVRYSDGRVPGEKRYVDSIMKLGLKDRFGNPIECKPGTIPMQRITLETMTHFRTLRDFLAKNPVNFKGPFIDGREPEFRPDWDSTHLHAYGGQSVDNFGGNSWLNLWNPKGDFTLSQHWYTGGTGSSNQTVEGGWMVEQDKYNTTNAVLFIYWTADNYKSTGCYNLDCTGFVQTNHNWYLGGTWNHYSATGGDQWGFEMQWKLYNGNWWLFLKGPGNYEAVGYYPTSIYNGGQMSKKATWLGYGGETTRKIGDDWPQMGSGELAATGWQHAAFQNTIFYIARDEDDGVGVWADLSTTVESLLTCYTISYVGASSGGNWGTYFFFGGPGGTTCN
jgi:hypothetical protein